MGLRRLTTKEEDGFGPRRFGFGATSDTPPHGGVFLHWDRKNAVNRRCKTAVLGGLLHPGNVTTHTVRHVMD